MTDFEAVLLANINRDESHTRRVYEAAGGYRALRQVFARMPPDELVDLVKPDEYKDAFMKGLSFHQLSFGGGHRNGAEAKGQMVASGDAFSKLLERGELKVPALRTLSMDELSSALPEMLNRRTVGKLVLKV